MEDEYVICPVCLAFKVCSPAYFFGYSSYAFGCKCDESERSNLPFLLQISNDNIYCCYCGGRYGKRENLLSLNSLFRHLALHKEANEIRQNGVEIEKGEYFLNGRFVKFITSSDDHPFPYNNPEKLGSLKKELIISTEMIIDLEGNIGLSSLSRYSREALIEMKKFLDERIKTLLKALSPPYPF